MVPNRRVDPRRVVGLSPDQLTLNEQIELCGMTVALEIYSPEKTPLRTIEAIGETVEDCLAELEARGLDPREYEFVVLKPPY
jgi:hypothetical protein